MWNLWNHQQDGFLVWDVLSSWSLQHVSVRVFFAVLQVCSGTPQASREGFQSQVGLLSEYFSISCLNAGSVEQCGE